MPLTLLVIGPICINDMLGSMGAVAWTVTMPENVEHDASPF